MLLLLIKVLNRCLPRKDSPLSTIEDTFSQTNKCNEDYTSVGISAVLKAKTLADEHGFKQSLKNSSLHDDKCPLFDCQPVYGKEIGKILRSLPSNKSPGPDKVTARVLKDS